MNRYDYSRYTKKDNTRYFIFDRLAGSTIRIATVYDVADAEMICSALNNTVKNERHSSI